MLNFNTENIDVNGVILCDEHYIVLNMLKMTCSSIKNAFAIYVALKLKRQWYAIHQIHLLLIIITKIFYAWIYVYTTMYMSYDICDYLQCDMQLRMCNHAQSVLAHHCFGSSLHCPCHLQKLYLCWCMKLGKLF